jgi:hypothetical protein
VPNQAFGSFAGGFLGSGGLALLAQDVNSLVEVAIGLDESSPAIAEAGVRSLPKFLYELSWDFHDWLVCAHPFISSKL